MYKLIIYDDNDNQTIYHLKNHEITVTDYEVILTLNTDKQTIKYGIRVDTRAKDLADIENFITKQLQETYLHDKPFIISEYLQRMYIFIGDDENSRQFTADKK